MGSPLAIGMGLVGAGAGAYGAKLQAQGQKGSLEYQAQVAGQNALIEDAKSRMAVEVGRAQEASMRQQTAQQVSAVRANAAGRGVVVDDGSANEAAASTALVGETNALTIRDNAARQQWGYQVQAYNDRNSAAYNTQAADAVNPRQDGFISLLGGLGGMAGLFNTGASDTKSQDFPKPGFVPNPPNKPRPSILNSLPTNKGP